MLMRMRRVLNTRTWNLASMTNIVRLEYVCYVFLRLKDSAYAITITQAMISIEGQQ